MRVSRFLTIVALAVSLLSTQFAPAVAFARADDARAAQPAVLTQAVLRALLNAATTAPASTAPRRGEAQAGSETPLAEADARKAVAEVAQILFGSIGALVGGLAVTANEFAHVGRELAVAEVVAPARQAQDVIASAMPFLASKFIKMPVRAILNLSLAGTGAGLTLGPSDSGEQSAIASFARLAITSARAEEPQDAEWNMLEVETEKLKQQFNSEVWAQYFGEFPVNNVYRPYAVRVRNAFVVAADETTARNAENALRALEAGVGALEAFLEDFLDLRGGELYASFERLLPRALYASLLARVLESGGTVPPREKILSDPKAVMYRAEQISKEEIERKAAELRGKLKDIEAQLAKKPDTATAARLSSSAEELRGVIRNLDRFAKAIPFAMQQIKEPTLSCSPLNTNAVLRKVKEFAVQTEVAPLLERYRKKLIDEAVEKIRKDYAGKIPAFGIDGIIARAMDASQTFQSADDQSWYNPDAHWYRPLPGRLRYGSGPRPNQAAAGIFGVAYGSVSARVQEIQMVGIYMAEDAFARFAADCTKPPSTVIQEVVNRLARYIDATSALSEEGAMSLIRGQLEEVVKEYEGGLSAVLSALDNGVYGNMGKIIGNLDTMNRSWTVVAPDATKLLAEVRAALLALKALGLETTAWIDDIEAAITPQPGKAKPPTSKTLSITCPGKSAQGKECAPERPVQPVQPPEYYNVCKFFGLPGYSIHPHPKPAYLCSNPGISSSDIGVTFVDGRPTVSVSVAGQPITISGNIIYTGRCCKSPECTHPNPDLVWGTEGLPRVALDNYWNFIGIANSDGSAARRVETCTMNLATDPNTPPERRPGCASFQATMDRGLDALCSWNLGAAPVPMDGPAVNVCLTGSAAEQEKLLSLLIKCVTKEEKDRVSLAFIWEQAKRFLKAWFLEFLQKEMDDLPKALSGDTQNILLGFLDDYTADELGSQLRRGYPVGENPLAASIIKFDRMLRAAVKRIRFTHAHFAPLWSNVSLTGPKVVEVRHITDPYGGIPQHVFNAVFAEVRRVLRPVFAEIEKDPLVTGIPFSDGLAYGDYIVAGAAAARAAVILNIARNFDAFWEREDKLSGTSLSDILSSAIKETNSDAKLGNFLPLGLEGIAARSNLLRKAGIKFGKFDLHAFLDKITDPERSTLPIKKFLAVAAAIDRVVDALKKLAEKDVEFSEAVTACVTGVESGDAISKVLKKLIDAMPEEEKIEDPYARQVVRDVRNLLQGVQSFADAAEGRKDDSLMGDALNDAFRNAANRLAREAADALRREQGVIRR